MFINAGEFYIGRGLRGYLARWNILAACISYNGIRGQSMGFFNCGRTNQSVNARVPRIIYRLAKYAAIFAMSSSERDVAIGDISAFLRSPFLKAIS